MKTVKARYGFRGGVHPRYNKELTTERPVAKIPLPPTLVVSMSQHLGAPAKCLVAKGETVVKGQLIGERNGFISVPVHANRPFHGRHAHFSVPIHENSPFHGQKAHFSVPIHKNGHFHGREVHELSAKTVVYYDR